MDWPTRILAVLALSTGLHAQGAVGADGRLQGRVLDAATGQAVAGATIVAGDRQTASDAGGRFELSLPAGEWPVKTTAPGYIDVGEQIGIVASGVRTIEIVLIRSQAYEERVEVTAPRVPIERPATIPVQTREVLAAAGTADNIFRVLQTMPGVAATEEFGSRLSVRGGSPDENLTIMDGVEIHNPYRLFGLTSAFNPETVSRFELTAGGFGAPYGDRLSSLLLVENRAGDPTTRFKGTAAMSLTDANVVTEGKLPGHMAGSWVATARRTYYDLIADRLVGTNLPSFTDVQTKGVWEPNARTRVSLFALVSREDTDASFDGSAPGESGAIVARTRNEVVSARYERQLAHHGTSTTTAAWYQNTDRLNFDGSFQPENQRSNAPDASAPPLTALSFSRDLTVKDASLRHELAFPLGRRQVVEAGLEVHRLNTGIDWLASYDRQIRTGNGSSVRGGAGLPDALNSSTPATRAGVWLQDRLVVNDRLTIQPGVRVDYSTFNGSAALSPRFAATVNLNGSTRLRTSGGLYVQSPGWEKFLQSDYLVDLTPQGSVNIADERSVHTVVSFEKDVSRALLFRAEGYYKTYSDLIVGRLETDAERVVRVAQYDFPPEFQSSIPTASIITSYPTNGATGNAYGFDLFVSRAPTGRGAGGPGGFVGPDGLGILHVRRGQPHGVWTDVSVRLRPSARGESGGQLPRWTEVRRRHDRAGRLGIPPYTSCRGARRRGRGCERPAGAVARFVWTTDLHRGRRHCRQPEHGSPPGFCEGRSPRDVPARRPHRAVGAVRGRHQRAEPPERGPDSEPARVRPDIGPAEDCREAWRRHPAPALVRPPRAVLVGYSRPSMSPRSLGRPVARLLRTKAARPMTSTSMPPNGPRARSGQASANVRPVRSVRMSMRPGGTPI